MVEQAAQIDPEMRLTYWGGRSYAAEFYTAGRAQALTNLADLAALASDSVRDAIAVRPDALEDASSALGPRFSNMGQFGRNFLLVEMASKGVKP